MVHSYRELIAKIDGQPGPKVPEGWTFKEFHRAPRTSGMPLSTLMRQVLLDTLLPTPGTSVKRTMTRGC